MMAALIRYADVNPYWNVPGSLAIKLIAPRVLEQGVAYLTERKDDVFADWSPTAVPLDPATVDWKAVKDGKLTLHIRQGPGGGNSMGKIKFMMPNIFGIYLHDTPDKSVFDTDQRWVSNGCIRLQDARGLAVWLFGEMPKAHDPNTEERVDLRDPVACSSPISPPRPRTAGTLPSRSLWPRSSCAHTLFWGRPTIGIWELPLS